MLTVGWLIAVGVLLGGAFRCALQAVEGASVDERGPALVGMLALLWAAWAVL